MTLLDDDGNEVPKLPMISAAFGLKVVAGTVVTSSRNVAQKFGKRHDNVLRSIDELIREFPECALSFEETFDEIAMPKTGARRDRLYVMNRKGFCQLIGEFTGREARRWRYDFIEAFDAMEAELLRRGRLPNSVEARFLKLETKLDGIEYRLIEADAKGDERHVEQMRAHSEHGNRLRKAPSQKTIETHWQFLSIFFDGICPCCEEVQIVRHGRPIVDEKGKSKCQIDHAVGTGKATVRQTWPVCVKCNNQRLVADRRKYDAEWQGYQVRLRKWLDRNSKQSQPQAVQHGFFAELPPARRTSH